jgi:hypothetical protein
LNSISDLGRVLVFWGIALTALGGLLLLGGKVGWLGHLPGDIVFRKGNFTFYFPLATSLLLSALLTILFSLLRR